MAVPAETPVATPDREPILATAVLVLNQVPPPETSVKFTEEPTQTELAPKIGCTAGLTVTRVVVIHPVLNL